MSDNKICRAALVGDAGVGKTCIISRFVNNIFIESTLSTAGATYACKNLDYQDSDKTIEFQIWDTAGQERFRALNKLYYKNAKIIILVYDITKKVTFTDIKDHWYKEIKENCSNDVSKPLFY